MSEDRVVAWVPPEISGPVANRPSRYSKAELDQIGQAAWEEGYARGQEAGRAAALNLMQPQINAQKARLGQVQSILDMLAAPLGELDAAVADELAHLACIIARHVVRRELRADPAQVIAAVREAVSLLPIVSRNVRVHLHPDDAAIVRERLAEPQSERAWVVLEDPVLERGGCRVVTENSQIDARLESRIGAVIATVLGDHRASSTGSYAVLAQGEP
jgi:flagellar assembly protein FliH